MIFGKTSDCIEEEELSMNLRRAKFVAAFVVVGVLVVFGITFTASPTPKSLS